MAQTTNSYDLLRLAEGWPWWPRACNPSKLPGALDKLPEEERQTRRRLWADAEAEIAKTRYKVK